MKNENQKVDDTQIAPAISTAANVETPFPKFVEEVIADYDGEIRLVRVNGGALGLGLGYYEVTTYEKESFVTSDPQMAMSRFVHDCLSQFVFLNFDVLLIFPDGVPSEFSDGQADPDLLLPKDNAGLKMIKKLRRILLTSREKLES